MNPFDLPPSEFARLLPEGAVPSQQDSVSPERPAVPVPTSPSHEAAVDKAGPLSGGEPGKSRVSARFRNLKDNLMLILRLSAFIVIPLALVALMTWLFPGSPQTPEQIIQDRERKNERRRWQGFSEEMKKKEQAEKERRRQQRLDEERKKESQEEPAGKSQRQRAIERHNRLRDSGD
jgi:hypothetical protein